MIKRSIPTNENLETEHDDIAVYTQSETLLDVTINVW